MSATRTKPRARPHRRFPRLTVRVDVTLEFQGQCVDAVATTLGAGGLYVAQDPPLAKGTTLWVHFRLPGERQRLRFQAWVAWSKAGEASQSGVGIEFLDPAERKELAAVLERWAATRSR